MRTIRLRDLNVFVGYPPGELGALAGSILEQLVGLRIILLICEF